MARVPLNPKGMGRRAFHNAYAKGAGDIISDTLKGNKLKTPKTTTPSITKMASKMPKLPKVK